MSRQPRDAANGVVGVKGAKDEVAGHGGPDGDLGGLEVAHFADHHDVRILAQDGAQAVREGEVDLRVHVDLGDACEPVFHRILDGDDAALGGVNSLRNA